MVNTLKLPVGIDSFEKNQKESIFTNVTFTLTGIPR